MNKYFLLLNALFFISCNQFLHIDPPIDQISTELVFNNNDAAKSAITSIYARIVNGGGFASGDVGSFTSIGGMAADELICYNTSYLEYYRNTLTPNSNSNLWTSAYQYVYSSNAILEGLSQSTNVSAAIKQQLEGEAKFIRAFCYFYLTNLYQDIPLHLTTDYRLNNTAIQTRQNLVYEQIIKDLTDAQALLGDDYYTTEKVRPNKWVATAMLARVYLYTGNWVAAERQATNVIEHNSLYIFQEDLNGIFLKNSSEAIWQLIPNKPGFNTNEGNLFLFTNTPTFVSLTKEMIDAFEPGDKRRASWIGSTTVADKTYYYPFKYKVNSTVNISEYTTLLRLTEQYLIRAEAHINQNKIDLGIQDLNKIRKRARAAVTPDVPNPLPDLPSTLSQIEALKAIERERRIELFSEWGHRWLDLKRTNKASAVLAPIKGASWQDTDILFPIPISEINANPKIVQNNGY